MTTRKFERVFDARVWKTGNALVVTIPSSIVKRFKIKEKTVLEITVKK